MSKNKGVSIGSEVVISDSNYLNAKHPDNKRMGEGFECTITDKIYLEYDSCWCWQLQDKLNPRNYYYVSIETLCSPVTSTQNFQAKPL